MTELTALWLPILVSSVIVFIASSVIHMALSFWHAGDYVAVPDQDKFRDLVRPLNVPPGDYMVPRPLNMKDWRTPEFQEKMKQGPVMMMTVLPNGPANMAKNLSQWFVYIVVVGIFAAYIASRALPVGAHYLKVFRFVGCTAFIGYSMALWQMHVWYRRSLSTTIKSTIDGLIYGLLTAGAFGWLWPR